MKRKGLQLVIAALLLLSLMYGAVPERVYACSCAMPLSVKESLESSDAVFVGKAVKIAGSGKWFIRSSADPVAVTFEVSQVWKGEPQASQTVYTAASSASCGFTFSENTEYVVYARKGEDGLQTTICDRTKALMAAAEDMAQLGEGRKPLQRAGAGEDFITGNRTVVVGLLFAALLLYILRKNRKV
ncbi:hypothetical protein [Paenibacillus silviterrae]|uniref:hypothetical protein n=1 Tax=Paenibacillus silviterrae TaxID=3242194 RepID=UPI002543B5A9|nr:hypothetical protein [Paenibacillus chinjuensis]